MAHSGIIKKGGEILPLFN